jgi:copper(I)-binding protein
MLKTSTRVLALTAAVSFCTNAFACQGHDAAVQSTKMSMPVVDPMTTAAMDVAETVRAADIEITGFWARAMLPNQPVAGGFLTLANTGADDRLMTATSPRAGRVELHEMMMEGDVMKMRAIEGGIALPAGATVELKPGGLHIMFFDIAERFEEGQTVPVTLTFEKAGAVTLELPVMNMQDMDHSKMDHTKHKHGG